MTTSFGTLTAYHAKLLAHELSLRSPSDSVEKLAAALADAQVDLNPHQVDAALFAFRSPFSKGAILADEVGLGKTIEAGLLLSQKWAEGRRKLLVIAPANLRKQWSQELADKFHLPSVILETRTFNETVKRGNLNPFDTAAVAICSYQFARSRDTYVRLVPWDLAVIDEAHRLRNVYKPTNKIANAIKQALATAPKVLLTATPLQNSLLELYGLVSIIDDHAFGDLSTYRSRFTRLADDGEFAELKERLRPVCKRTLRRQVLEYVKYTNRHAIVQEFYPTADEQRLYDLVTDYLLQPNLYALPSSQRQLMTLILRKLLASSTYAISNTLEGLARKLEFAHAKATSTEELPPELTEDIDDLDELADEWNEDDGETAGERVSPRYSAEQLTEMQREVAQLREFHQLARSIMRNSKGDVLLTALRRGFDAAAKAQGGAKGAALQQKAIIFTESRKTQEYLLRILEQTEFKGRITIFNGTNSDPASKAIYQRWIERNKGTDKVSGSPTADMRAALVEHFRDESSILIATEAAAEGINLQFCNVVVNYDLPWNPQRIEQRIGRCHRYGQKFDVVVVNFLNKSNAADQRVYQLLDEKFRLFNGVFGASDEVLGAVESGVDFEKRIAGIYQKCRSPQQISFEFDALQRDLETEISEGQRQAREKLLNNFDQEVIERVKIQSHAVLDRVNERLWRLAQHVLAANAVFEERDYSFSLLRNPFPDEPIHPGPYRLTRAADDANVFRVGHPLAQRLMAAARAAETPASEIVFQYAGSGKNIAALQPIVGASGWLACARMTITALQAEDSVIFTAFTDAGDVLDTNQCRRLFDLPGAVTNAADESAVTKRLSDGLSNAELPIFEELNARNGRWFDVEIEKLERWTGDRRDGLKVSLDELDARIKETKKAARFAPSLPEKLRLQREVKTLEGRRDEAWRAFDQASRELERDKEKLLDDIERRLTADIRREPLFTLRWRLL